VAESYTMGFWTAKAGEEDAFVAAWTEFAEWMKEHPADWDGIEPIHAWKSTPEFRERIGRVRRHTHEFRPAEAELAVRVDAAASVH
jgi:hypothetical protein